MELASSDGEEVPGKAIFVLGHSSSVHFPSYPLPGQHSGLVAFLGFSFQAS